MVHRTVSLWGAKMLFKNSISALFCLLVFALSGSALAAPERWISVDTKSKTLAVYDGKRLIEKFNHIAIGASGAKLKQRRGDDATPIGKFRIGWKNMSSKFHIFLGLDYPTPEYALTGYRRGIISKAVLRDLLDHYVQGRTPPQNTPLGGYIGIHGIGRGDLNTHRIANWTSGCVALTNEEIERLNSMVEVGARVIIR